MEKTEKYIDIKEVVRSKNATLARWMPGFITRYLKRVIHQDEINGIMSRIGHMEGLEFVNAGMKELQTDVDIHGMENVPKEGGVVLASNHPLGGLDGIALMKAVGEIRSDFKFLVNDVLLNIENLQPLFVPVNKMGENPRTSSKIISETYAQDIAILIFPAGLVSRKQAHGIEDLEWKKSFITRAIKYKKDVVPVYIEGRNSKFFYNLSRFRRMIGIKGNIEMLYLSDEMFRQRGEVIPVCFGKPIPYTTFDKSKSHQEWADEVKRKAYSLSKR